MSLVLAKWIAKNTSLEVAGDGSLSVRVASTGGLEITASGVGVKPEGIVNSMIKAGTIEEDRIAVVFIRADGANDFTADQNMAGHKLTNVGDPVLAGDAVNKQYVLDVINGIDRKASVRAATTVAYGNVDLAVGGLLTIDGVTLEAGDRVLVKNQTDPVENGIYVAAVDAWTRAPDADGSQFGKVSTGMVTYIEEGTKNQRTGWSMYSPGGLKVVGTDPLLFTQSFEAGEILAGAGMVKTGTTLDVVVGHGLVAQPDVVELVLKNYTLVADATGLYVPLGGITETEIKNTALGSGLQGGSGAVIKLGALTENWATGGNYQITGLPNPVNDTDAVRKEYVDDAVAAITERKALVVTLSAADISNKYIALGEIPANPTSVSVTPKGGPQQFYGDDFIMDAGEPTHVTWNGLGMDGVLLAGDKLYIEYDQQ